MSNVSRSPNSRIFFFIKSANLKRIFFLLLGAILDQEPFSKTTLAAFTASLTSSISHSATEVISVPSAGEKFSNTFPDIEFTYLPFMNA